MIGFAVVHISLIDAFAETPFTGNPAVVCLLNQRWPDDDRLQSFAAEMNQSETAYVLRERNRFELRWFTPSTEVDLCGHATLAASHALWRWGVALENQTICFASRSGELLAERGEGNEIVLDFPAEPAVELPTVDTNVLEALGHPSAIWFGKNRSDFLLQLADENQLRNLRPDFDLLGRAACRGLIVTALSSNPKFDFVSRFFAPSSGILEDPVTGSAHCCLAEYWSKRLGKLALVGFQASLRGGIVHVELRGNRVFLSGTARTVFDGQVAPGIFVD